MVVVSGWLTARDYFVRWAALPQLGGAFSLSEELAAEEAARQLGGNAASGVAGSRVLISNGLFMQPQLAFAVGVPTVELALPEVEPGRASYLLQRGFDAQEPMFLLWSGQPGVKAALLAPASVGDVAALRTGLEGEGTGQTVQAANHREGWPRLVTGPLPGGMALSLRSIGVPMDVGFAGGVRLFGYEVQPPEGEGEGQAPAVTLTTFWGCDPAADLERMNKAAVFLHLASDGVVWRTANHDLPSMSWLGWPHTCTMLIDRRSVALPPGFPAGKAYFETGLYWPASDDRIPIVAPSEQGLPEQVVIGAFMLDSHPSAAAVDDLRPVGATLDGRLELTAWRAVLVQPGTLRVELAWRSLDRTGTNYTAFVHLIDGDGQMVAQHDEASRRNDEPYGFVGAGRDCPQLRRSCAACRLAA